MKTLQAYSVVELNLLISVLEEMKKEDSKKVFSFLPNEKGSINQFSVFLKKGFDDNDVFALGAKYILALNASKQA